MALDKTFFEDLEARIPKGKVRTRFAPSPTGYMHVGNLRTALYTWLIARHADGIFILRIEDTDQGRLVEGATDVIYRTMKECHLDHDEGPDVGGPTGPYIQSQRRDTYGKYARLLVEKGGFLQGLLPGLPGETPAQLLSELLARLTATPLLGVLTGLAVTAVLQSSSAATVMVIGFVSAGLLELPRAVAVIYGINIGTTMTAQLIAFDVQTLVYPVLFLGFLLDFAARRPRWQAVGEAVFSFGLLFEGIDILGRALQPLAGQAVFLDWMTRVKESPLLGILLGLSMTMVVQSSSATIALLQNVARQAGPDGIHSVLGLAGAVPVLLGDNIGTTVTALLACIGQGKDAARAALAHSCFNLSGSLLAAMLLPWFVRLVEFISPKGPELEVISRQIANAHTAFNVCCALLWLPFLPWMVRLVCALVPEDR